MHPALAPATTRCRARCVPEGLARRLSLSHGSERVGGALDGCGVTEGEPHACADGCGVTDAGGRCVSVASSSSVGPSETAVQALQKFVLDQFLPLGTTANIAILLAGVRVWRGCGMTCA